MVQILLSTLGINNSSLLFNTRRESLLARFRTPKEALNRGSQRIDTSLGDPQDEECQMNDALTMYHSQGVWYLSEILIYAKSTSFWEVLRTVDGYVRYGSTL